MWQRAVWLLRCLAASFAPDTVSELGILAGKAGFLPEAAFLQDSLPAREEAQLRASEPRPCYHRGLHSHPAPQGNWLRLLQRGTASSVQNDHPSPSRSCPSTHIPLMPLPPRLQEVCLFKILDSTHTLGLPSQSLSASMCDSAHHPGPADPAVTQAGVPGTVSSTPRQIAYQPQS